MKRALAAALAAQMVLSPLAAEAKILITSTRDATGGAPTDDQLRLAQRRFEQLFTDICDRAGVEYRIVNVRGTKTLWAATGTQVWGQGASQWTEQFDAVVHLGFLGADAGVWAAALGGAATCRPESMLIGGNSGKAPTVPQWMIMSGLGAIPSNAMDQAACTTGVKATAQFVGRMMYFAADHALRTIDGALTDAVVRNSSDPAGGYRSHIGAAIGSLVSQTGLDFGTVGGGVNCVWCDSLVAPSTTRDSVLMWERPMAHISTANGASFNAAPVLFSSIANDGLGTKDSTTGANAADANPQLEGSAVLILSGLARLDSLTGGDVFTDKSKLPIKLGVTVDGGFAHNGRMHPRGSAVDDSAIVKATIDSIVAYNALSNRPKIKITLGVNIDSVDSYPNEKAWWSALGPNIRYSPQSWVAIADTAKGGGNASFSNPRDPLGRFRKRAAFGDTTGWNAGDANNVDSSTTKLLMGSRFKIRSTFGADKMSGLLMPTDDDWSDLNGVSDGTRRADSTVFAIARAGFSAIRVNGVDRDCDPNYLRVNHKGYLNKQMRYVSTVRNTPLNILAYNGFPLGGGEKLAYGLLDTVTTPFWQVKPHKEIARALNGLVYRGVADYEMFPYDDHYSQFGGGPTLAFYQGVHLNVKDKLNSVHNRASLMRLSVSDFSGSATRPARLGWWTLKSIANSMAMVNRLAGRTILTIDWPENIEP